MTAPRPNMLLLLWLFCVCCLFSSAASVCAYINFNGIAIPLNYCLLIHESADSEFGMGYTCEHGLAYYNQWNNGDCRGTPDYKESMFFGNDYTSMSCAGSGDDCDGVTLKYYESDDDGKCLTGDNTDTETLNGVAVSAVYTRLKVVTDKCLYVEEGISRKLKCGTKTITSYVYHDEICRNLTDKLNTDESAECEEITSCKKQAFQTSDSTVIIVVVGVSIVALGLILFGAYVWKKHKMDASKQAHAIQGPSGYKMRVPYDEVHEEEHQQNNNSNANALTTDDNTGQDDDGRGESFSGHML